MRSVSKAANILGQAVPELLVPLTSEEEEAAILELLTVVPWGQNLLIIKKIDAPAARLYYLLATAQFGWTRNVLLNQIKAGAYERPLKEGKSHNFALALPGPLVGQVVYR